MTGVLVQKRSWLPWGIFAVGLLLLNWGLYARLQPRAPVATPLPFWEAFDGTDLANWTTLSGKWSLDSGVLKFSQGSEVLLRAPISLEFQQTYQLRLNITLEPDDRAEIIFNAQYPDHIARSQYLRLHRGEKLELSTGYSDGAGVVHETARASTSPNRLRLTLEIGAKTYRLRLGQRYLLPEQPLHYRGGLVFLQGSGVPAFDDLQVENWQYVPLNTSQKKESSQIQENEHRLLYSAKLEGELSENWSVVTGDWKLENSSLLQTDAQGFDRVILEKNHIFKEFRYRVSFQQLQGVGAGLVFNAENPKRKANAQLVRFGEDGKVMFWGYWDDREVFKGQGFAPVALSGKDSHVLEVVSRVQSYDLLLDGKYLAREVKLMVSQGHIGLSTSQSAAAFSEIQVEALNAAYLPSTPNKASGLALAGHPMQALDGRWVQQGQALRQLDSTPSEFWAVASQPSRLRKLRLNLWLEGAPDSAAGIGLRPQPGILEDTLALRLTDGGRVVAWGYYQAGEFKAKGSKTITPIKVHTLSLERVGNEFRLGLDGNALARLPAAKQGYLSLSSLGGPALFSLLELETQ